MLLKNIFRSVLGNFYCEVMIMFEISIMRDISIFDVIFHTDILTDFSMKFPYGSHNSRNVKNYCS